MGTWFSLLLTRNCGKATGSATDFCVDTTVRAAASRDYEVALIADGHTTRDRPHLEAAAIIQHHNWMWELAIETNMTSHSRRNWRYFKATGMCRDMGVQEDGSSWFDADTIRRS